MLSLLGPSSNSHRVPMETSLEYESRLMCPTSEMGDPENCCLFRPAWGSARSARPSRKEQEALSTKQWLYVALHLLYAVRLSSDHDASGASNTLRVFQR